MSSLDLYFSIFEGANDAAYRKQALDMFKKVQAALRTPKGAGLVEEYGKTAMVNLGELLGNEALENLDLVFVLGEHEKRSGSFKIEPKPTIELNVSPRLVGIPDEQGDTKDWGAIVQKQAPEILQRMHDTFIHEFIHFLDHTRMGAKGDTVFNKTAEVQKGDEENGVSEPERLKKYVNSPMEFNAFFQQGIGNIEKYLSSLPPESRLKVAQKMLGNSPNEFWKHITDSFKEQPWFRNIFIKNLDDKNRAKLMKRVAQAYTEIMKKEKAAQTWRGGAEKDKTTQINRLKAANKKAKKSQERS